MLIFFIYFPIVIFSLSADIETVIVFKRAIVTSLLRREQGKRDNSNIVLSNMILRLSHCRATNRIVHTKANNKKNRSLFDHHDDQHARLINIVTIRKSLWSTHTHTTKKNNIYDFGYVILHNKFFFSAHLYMIVLVIVYRTVTKSIWIKTIDAQNRVLLIHGCLHVHLKKK